MHEDADRGGGWQVSEIISQCAMHFQRCCRSSLVQGMARNAPTTSLSHIFLTILGQSRAHGGGHEMPETPPGSAPLRSGENHVKANEQATDICWRPKIFEPQSDVHRGQAEERICPATLLRPTADPKTLVPMSQQSRCKPKEKAFPFS